MKHLGKFCVWLAAALVVALTTVPTNATDQEEPWQAKHELSDAVQGYTGYDYNVKGSFEWKEKGKTLKPKDRSKKATEKHEGIGFSSFVAIVLTRVRYGEKWGEHFDLRLYQEDGDGIASAFDLGEPVVTLTAADVIDGKTTGLTKSNVYLFNIEEKVDGTWQGRHVGFVTLNSNGELNQSQYSGLSRKKGDTNGGYHTGSYADWFKRTKYGNKLKDVSRVEFFRVPQPK